MHLDTPAPATLPWRNADPVTDPHLVAGAATLDLPDGTYLLAHGATVKDGMLVSYDHYVRHMGVALHNYDRTGTSGEIRPRGRIAISKLEDAAREMFAEGGFPPPANTIRDVLNDLRKLLDMLDRLADLRSHSPFYAGPRKLTRDDFAWAPVGAEARVPGVGVFKKLESGLWAHPNKSRDPYTNDLMTYFVDVTFI